jgi:hypothetical protein
VFLIQGVEPNSTSIARCDTTFQLTRDKLAIPAIVCTSSDDADSIRNNVGKCTHSESAKGEDLVESEDLKLRFRSFDSEILGQSDPIPFDFI